MNRIAQTLARRYATAYIQVFDEQLTQKDFDALRSAQQFFSIHKQSLYFLSLPTIADKQKLQVIGKVFRHLDLPTSCMRLMTLLVAQKRASLWYDILIYIVKLYQQRHNMMDVHVESAPELDKQQLEVIEQFLADETGNDIMITYRVDPALIAGIRARSDTVLWEYSIAKKLRAIRLSCIQDKG